MLYIDKATILKFDLEMLKKHRRAIQFIAVLLFIVGLLLSSATAMPCMNALSWRRRRFPVLMTALRKASPVSA